MNGINNSEVRNVNRNSIIEILRTQGAMTKKEIARQLDLSLATVTTLLRELLDEQLVEPGEVLASTGGRKPVVFQIAMNARLTVGIALTGHHIRMALTNWGQEIKAVRREKITFENTPEYWARLKELVSEFLAGEAVAEEQLLGIGICIHGIILAGGTIEGIVPNGIFKDIDTSRVKAMYDCPVLFVNDVKAAAFSHIGSPAERNTIVYLQLDRLIGGAVIADGTFWGLSNRTGEFGHMYMGENHVHCYCGKTGCLQTHCSTMVLREKSGRTLEEYFAALQEGDARCEEIWKEYLFWLAKAIHNLRVIFDIDIMIGGQLAPYISGYEEVLKEALAAADIYHEQPDYLRFSKGGEYDGAIGAAYLILENS